MDFSNFVKNYYKLAIKELNNFSKFYGTIVETNDSGLGEYEKYMHEVKYNFPALINLEPSIDSPVETILALIEANCESYPELKTVLFGKEGLEGFYRSAVVKGINDSQIMYMIEAILYLSINTLEKMGVLVK